MKLRQKIKNAKRDLKHFDATHRKPNDTLGLVSYIKERMDLVSKATIKQQKNTYTKGEQSLELATHIKFYADFNLLGELKSPNGKPLTMKRIKEFYRYIDSTNIASYIKRTAESEPRVHGKLVIDKVRYTLHYSTDRTKNKSFCYGLLFEQKYGSSELDVYIGSDN